MRTLRTVCIRGLHTLTPDNVRLDRGKRICRACRRTYRRAHRLGISVETLNQTGARFEALRGIHPDAGGTLEKFQAWQNRRTVTVHPAITHTVDRAVLTALGAGPLSLRQISTALGVAKSAVNNSLGRLSRQKLAHIARRGGSGNVTQLWAEGPPRLRLSAAFPERVSA